MAQRYVISMQAFLTVILGNLGFVFVAIAIVTGFVKIGRRRISGRAAVYDVIWGELLFYGVGLMMLCAATFHAFFQSLVVPSIGWVPSPFEWELAWAEYGIASIAILSLRSGDAMRLATTLVYVIFSFGAAAQHVHQILCCANDSPNNAGPILWINDIAVPLVVLYLAYALRPRAGDSRMPLGAPIR